MTNVFLDNNGLVRGPSVGEEAGLGRPYDILEEGLDSIDNYLMTTL